MKKISHILLLGKVFLSIAAVCLMALSMAVLSACVNNGGGDITEVEGVYVDLGLASGTMWKSVNESAGNISHYSYDQAIYFGKKLPTKEQLEELRHSCIWSWQGRGYKVVGPNGKFIYLPAHHVRRWYEICPYSRYDSYWSSTSDGIDEAWELYIDSTAVGIHNISRNEDCSVRLVQCGGNNSCAYVDLGLTSGTKWKSTNESVGDFSLYSYEQAISNFGEKLPTKEQFEELQRSCMWTWEGKGYKITGPSGQSIILPAAGARSCEGKVYSVGYCGHYWSSTPFGSDHASSLDFKSHTVDMGHTSRCEGFSVRLVQN